MKSLFSLLSDPDIVLSLEPEELAGYLIEHLKSLSPYDQANLNRYNFSLGHTFAEYPQGSRPLVQRAWMEAWSWLEREGIVAPKPEQQGEWVFITRKGQALRGRLDIELYQKAARLPRKLLHPRIAADAWPLFLRGAFDTAVFQAFKEVEVAVRTAGGYQPTDLGVPLMRLAFDANHGPLTDPSRPLAERESLAHLFAGAIGSYKNPTSHRHVGIDVDEAAEMLILASHLLRIVEDRVASKMRENA